MSVRNGKVELSLGIHCDGVEERPITWVEVDSQGKVSVFLITHKRTSLYPCRKTQRGKKRALLEKKQKDKKVTRERNLNRFLKYNEDRSENFLEPKGISQPSKPCEEEYDYATLFKMHLDRMNEYYSSDDEYCSSDDDFISAISSSRDSLKSHYDYDSDVGSWYTNPPEVEEGDVIKSQGLFDINFTHKLDEGTLESVRESVFESFSAATNITAESASQIRGVLSDTVSTVSASIELLLDEIKKAFWIVPILGACVFMAYSPKKAAISAAIFAMLTSIMPESMNPIKELLMSAMPSDDVPVPQAGFFDISVIEKVISLSTIFMFVGPSKYKHALSLLEQKVNSFKMNTNKNVDLATSIMTTIENTVMWIQGLLGFEKQCIFKTGEKEVNDWCDKLSQVTHDFTLCKTEISSDVVETLQALRSHGMELEKAYRMDKTCTHILRNYMQQLDAVCRANASAFAASRGIRQEPVCLGLYGAPGIGKTILCNTLSHAIMAEVLPVEKLMKKQEEGADLSDEIYQQGTSEFWNGYAGQYTLAIDDFGQQVDAIGARENDFMNLIKVVNSWQLPLNFADLENKGKNNFRSKLIMLTTNAANLKEKSARVVQCADAVIRRIHHRYQLGVNDAFRLPGCGPFDARCLDTNKINEYYFAHKEYPLEAWFVTEHDFATGKQVPNSGRLTLQQLVDRVVRDLKMRENEFHNTNAANKTMINKILARRLERNPDVPQAQGGTFSLQDDLQGVDQILGPTPPEEGSKLEVLMSYLKDTTAVLRKKLPHTIWNPNAMKLQYPLMAIAGGTAIFGIFKIAKFALSSICKTWFGEEEEKPKQQSVDHTLLQEISNKNNLPLSAQNVVSKNIFKISIVNPRTSGYVNLGGMLGIVGKTFIMPSHFDDIIQLLLAKGKFDVYSIITLRNVINSDLSTEFNVQDFLSFERSVKIEDDFLAIKLPISFATADIRNKFVKESDLPTLKNIGIVLYGVTDVGGKCARDMRFAFAARHDNFAVEAGTMEYKLARGYRYCIPTVEGDCGSVMMVGPDVNHTAGRKIVGLHSAGIRQKSLGFSTIVTAEMIDDVVRGFDEIVDDSHAYGIVAQADTFDVGGSFMPLYKVNKGTHMAPYSKLEKTDLYNTYTENSRFPAHLSQFKTKEGEEIKPMCVALGKYNGQVRAYSQDEVDDAAYVAFQPITKATQNIPKECREVISFEDAVQGIPGNKFAKGMPRNTSAGWPLSAHGARGKKDFFGDCNEYDFENYNARWMKDTVAEIIEKAKNNVRMMHPFHDFLKDERRSKKKNDKGESRLVSGAPLAYVIAFRMYFLTFMSSLMETRIENGCAAGVNPYSEWKYLRDHLLNNSDRVIAGDYSAFDSSEQPQIHEAILDYINEWYDDGEENATVRRVLWRDLTNSRHVGGDGKNNDTIYQWFHSLPSGHPATTTVNSMYNLVMFVMCWGRIMGKHRLKDYHENVRPVVLGDDNVVSIKARVIPEFNQTTVTSVMSDLGMTYTPESKDDEHVPPTRSIDEVSFLKREFREENGYVYGPLAMQSILEMPFWCRDRKFKQEIMESNFETALMELSAHPQETWDEWAPKMLDAYKSLGRQTMIRPDRKMYQSVFRNAIPNH